MFSGCGGVEMARTFNPNWRKREPARCFGCGVEFLAVSSELKRGNGKFCSRQCHRANNARRNAAAMRSPIPEVARRRMRRAAEPREVSLAHDAVEQALLRGEVTRQPCERCGDPKAEAHHEDYSQPLVLMWLCRLHHKRRHKALREQGIVLA